LRRAQRIGGQVRLECLSGRIATQYSIWFVVVVVVVGSTD
jgi:hypothetical protein